MIWFLIYLLIAGIAASLSYVYLFDILRKKEDYSTEGWWMAVILTTLLWPIAIPIWLGGFAGLWIINQIRKLMGI